MTHHRHIQMAWRTIGAVTWVFALTWVLMTTAAAADPAPGPSAGTPLADAQHDFDAGQYRPALQKIAKALSGTSVGKDAAARYDLLMLRGECQLKLNERSLAIEAFRSAARTMKKDGDLNKLASASAFGTLIEASKKMTYTPMQTGGESAKPIDIVAPDSRKQALAALFSDRMAKAKPAIDKALESNVLTPTLDLMPTLRETFFVEAAATNGEAPQSRPMLKSLGEHARTLMTTELTRISRRIQSIEDGLSEQVYLDIRNIQGVRERGLSTAEKNELHDISDYLAKIEQVAQQGRSINRRVGGTGDVWDPIVADCAATTDDARDLAARK